MSQRQILLRGAISGIVAFLVIGAVIATTALQQQPLTTDQMLIQTDAAFMTVNAADAATDARYETQIAALLATRQTLPSPTPFPTWTRTPQGTPPTPTPEDAPGLTLTAVTNLPPTQTATPRPATASPTRTATLAASPTNIPGVPGLDYSCNVITTTSLTRRISAPTAPPMPASAGVIPAGTTLHIYPYQTSVFYNPTGTSYLYVRIHDSSGGGYVAYGSVTMASPQDYPILTDRWFEPEGGNLFCFPVIVR